MDRLIIPIGVEGPIIDVLFGVKGAKQAALLSSGQPIPLECARLLIDTGSSRTIVDKDVIVSLATTPTGCHHLSPCYRSLPGLWSAGECVEVQGGEISTTITRSRFRSFSGTRASSVL
jgi:hypothetical protein